MSTPGDDDAGRRQADYFREVLRHDLAETHQRIGVLAASMSALVARDEAPLAVRRTHRALKAAIAKRGKVTGMLDALERSYPASATAVAS
jgi:hypothetical protein